MSFTITPAILTGGAFFLEEKEAYSGVRKIADKVKSDIELVFGVRPTSAEAPDQLTSCAVIYGTVEALKIGKANARESRQHPEPHPRLI